MNILTCFCCSIFNALIYTACANLQWILFANESELVGACLNDITLAAAILSSLATLFKLISTSCSSCLVANSTGTSKTTIVCDYLLKFLQLLLKFAALGYTVYSTTNRIIAPCSSTTADPNHQELPPLGPLIIVILSLESVSSIIETTSLIYDVCCKCCQKARSQKSSDDDTVNKRVEQL